MAVKNTASVTPSEISDFHLEADGQDPPPPPPPPPFSSDVMASTIGAGTAGAAVAGSGGAAATIAQALSANPQQPPLEAMSGTNFLAWIIVGFVLGAIYGIVSSSIHNLILRNSRGSKAFKVRYPGAQDVPYDHLFVFWVEERMVHLFRYIKANFRKLE